MVKLLRHPVAALTKGLFVAVCGFLSPLALAFLFVASGQPWTLGRVLVLLLTVVLGVAVGRTIGRATLANWRNRNPSPNQQGQSH